MAKEDVEAAMTLFLLRGEVATDFTENGAKIHGYHDLPPKKILNDSDLNRNQNYLSFSVNKEQNEFLTQEEVDKVSRATRAGAKDEEDGYCVETEGGGDVVSSTALSADKGPTAVLTKAGLIGGIAAVNGESDVVIAVRGILTCRDVAKSMYGDNSGRCTIVEGAD
ncbi:hypothetical protein LWI28_026669 [Acer negundo]|uniref:Uncharacterized protein n=1 Tax=Acer negundo TaxID=4023 RepID=A0AAD5NT48_ACENE|nr:hypothetical protein LWI28_026669 [Acer negundo]